MSEMRDAARDFAQEALPQDHNVALRALLAEVFEAGAKWQAEQPPADGEVLAAFNPRSARELIDRCEKAEAAVARVRAVHRRWVRRDGPVVCAWCDANGSGDAEWPCRTIRALDGEDA